MKTVFAKWFGASWETTVIGWIIILCGMTSVGGALYDYMTAQQIMLMMGFCAILKGLGFIRAKDGNVSNSSSPAPAATIIETSTGTAVRNAVVPCIGLLLLAGCSAFQKSDPGAVLMKLSADRQSVLVAGCAGMPARHVLLNTILPFIPPQYGLPAAGALAIETAAASALCATVQTTPAVQQPFVAATVTPIVSVVPATK